MARWKAQHLSFLEQVSDLDLVKNARSYPTLVAIEGLRSTFFARSGCSTNGVMRAPQRYERTMYKLQNAVSTLSNGVVSGTYVQNEKSAFSAIC
jgi:hypothetical protein